MGIAATKEESYWAREWSAKAYWECFLQYQRTVADAMQCEEFARKCLGVTADTEYEDIPLSVLVRSQRHLKGLDVQVLDRIQSKDDLSSLSSLGETKDGSGLIDEGRIRLYLTRPRDLAPIVFLRQQARSEQYVMLSGMNQLIAAKILEGDGVQVRILWIY